MKEKIKPENFRSLKFEIRLSPSEMKRLKENCANTTSQNLSEYIRRATLGDPVNIFYRNKSFDEFVEEIVRLRNELQAIRERMPADPRGFEVLILEKIIQIKTSINKLADYVRDNSNYKRHIKNPGI